MSRVSRVDTVRWDDVAIGDQLPPMTIDVTATVIVAGALATRDFMPVPVSYTHLTLPTNREV